MGIDVVIVGGGIAGLAAAYELKRRAVTFVVLERASQPGGVIVSEEIDGYTIDAGPDSLLIQKPDGIRLCEELGLGIGWYRHCRRASLSSSATGSCTPCPRRRCSASRRGSDRSFGRGLFSWRAKMRMGAEIFVPRRSSRAIAPTNQLARS